MSLAAQVLGLYHRTRAQYRHLTSASLVPADHNHVTRPLAVAFPVHRSRTPPRRRSRPLATALRHLLTAAFPAPPPTPPRPAPPASLPSPAVAHQRPCRLCAATVHP